MTTPEKPNETPLTAEQKFSAAVFEIAKGSIDRARSGAEFVEKAAAAVATVYVGVLGLAFSVSDNALPLRGVIPAVFLGLAVAGATYYLAFPVGSRRFIDPDDAEDKAEDKGEDEGEDLTDEGWMNAFTELTTRMTTRRGWALRAGILSLVFGVLFLPTPFVKVKTAPPKPATQTLWPTLRSANLPLHRILFLEQVKEAGRLRREGSQAPAGRRGPPIAWPTVPSVNAPLERILFTEKVKEVSRLRSEAKPTPIGQFKTDEKYVWWLAGVALALVVLMGAVSKYLDWRRENPKKPSKSAGNVHPSSS